MALKTYELPATFTFRAHNEQEARDAILHLTMGVEHMVAVSQDPRRTRRVYFNYSTVKLRRITWPRRRKVMPDGHAEDGQAFADEAESGRA